MFLRWKRRKLPSRADYALDAVLLMNVRESGRVKQKFVKYLGSIRERNIAEIGFRIAFWEKAEQEISSLSLSPAARGHLERQVMAKVPRPEKFEKRLYEKRRREVITNFWAKTEKKISRRTKGEAS